MVTAQSKKAEAQGLVDALPDVLKGDMATRLNNLTGIQVPEVNDADGNGIADDVDQAKARAENKVIEAESIDQTAKAKLVEYQEDGLIIEPEKVDLENLSAMAQSKKAEAQRLVDALPDVLKGDLPTRLNNLTGIQVPEVNDADGNNFETNPTPFSTMFTMLVPNLAPSPAMPACTVSLIASNNPAIINYPFNLYFLFLKTYSPNNLPTKLAPLDTISTILEPKSAPLPALAASTVFAIASANLVI